jgi:hypothetical protein
VINEDRRLWKRNYKIGMLPGDIPIQQKVEVLSRNKDFKRWYATPRYTDKQRQGYRKEVFKKSNRRWRHEFKTLNPEDLLDTH